MKKIFIAISLLFSLTLTSANAVEVSVEEKITGLYVAYFNRAADQAGLTYWTTTADNVTKQAGDISSVFKTLSKGFATHPTFTSTYAPLNNEEFVAAIYRNALGRDGDAEGIKYWADLVERVMSRSDMVATFVELSMVTDLTKENYPNLSDDELAAAQLRQDLITNKVTVAVVFTKQLEELSNVVNSDAPESDPAYLASIKIISEVTENSATVSSVQTFLESILYSDDPVGDILGNNSLNEGTIYAPALTLKENDFWVYKWQETWTTSAQGSSPSVENKHGEFRITLGDTTSMNGEEAFPVAIEGDSGEYAPRWKYLAISDDNSLLGSTGGEFQVIYSATETQWEGGGFLISFKDTDGVKVQTSTYEGVYNTLDAIRVSHADSSGGCEYVLSYQFCSENSVTARVDEHYKKGLGAVGSSEYYYYSYSSGGFTTTHKKESSVELIDSSLNASDGSKLNKPTWEEVATLPNTVTYHSTAILDNKIYISGRGLGYIQVFNITTNSFEENVNLPDSIYDYNLQVLDGYLYIMNKENGIIKLIDTTQYTVEYVNSFSSYTVLTNWDYLNTNNNTTSNYTIAMSPSVLSSTASIYLFDPYSNQWYTFNEPLSNYNKWIGFEIIEVSNILYFIGGTYISNSTWNTRSTYENIKRFDLSTGLWFSNTAKMNTTRKRDFALVKYNGKLIVFGGSDGTKSVATVEEYDPDTDSWKNLEALPEPLSGIQAVATENKVYVITPSKILSFVP